MDEYIEREAAEKELMYAMVGTGYQSRAIDAIKFMPAADVVEVRHGEWRPRSLDPQDPYFVCTNCRIGYSTVYHEGDEMKYCPNCGAKMDGKGEGNE